MTSQTLTATGSTPDTSDLRAVAQAQAAGVIQLFQTLRDNIAGVFVGQQELVDFILFTAMAGGHVLIEGVPGLGKTLLVRTLADSLQLPMSRIQFTPDLMPADITGTTVLTEVAGGGHELKFQPGPLVASLVLADEINRATPKTQSALLEAMQESQITVAGRTIVLPEPFMVLATQNPVEQEGTYPLPEAQLDRFLVKLLVRFPTEAEFDEILQRTTGKEMPHAAGSTSGADLLLARQIVRSVPTSRQTRLYAIKLVMATQPDQAGASPLVKRYLQFGAGPRAAQALLLLAKARAITQGRFAISCEDIRVAARPVLRHRMMLNFAGLAERISPDSIVDELVKSVSEFSV